MKKICLTVSMMICITACTSQQGITLKKHDVKTTSTLKLYDKKVYSGIEVDNLPVFFNLSKNNYFKERYRLVTNHNTNAIKLQQYFKGVPVSGYFITIEEKEGKVLNITGRVIKNIPDNLLVSPILTQKDALNKIRQNNNYKYTDSNKDNNNAPIIFITSEGNAKLAYVTSYYSSSPTKKRVITVIDANNANILKTWDIPQHKEDVTKIKDMGLSLPATTVNKIKNDKASSQYVTGIGGNVITGEYKINKLPVLLYKLDGLCYLIDTFHNIETYKNNDNTPYSFKCESIPEDPYNGGYSPVNDAHYFAGLTMDMIKEYSGVDLSNINLKTRVFYNSIDNGEWTGDHIDVDGGGKDAYPDTTLDIVAHETGHAFTDKASDIGDGATDLLNDGIYQYIGEVFSDMTAEAAKYYALQKDPNAPYGQNNFIVGLTHAKTSRAVTRDMCVYDYARPTSKVFCLLAKTKDWNTKKAYQVFARANHLYWHKDMSVNEEVCYSQKSAFDLGYSVDDVKAAYATQGLACESGMPKDFSYIKVLRTGTLYSPDVGFPETWYKGAQFELVLETTDKVEWRSSDDKVASVSQNSENGIVTLNNPGQATISVVDDKGQSLSYNVNLKKDQQFIPLNFISKSTPEMAQKYCNAIDATLALKEELTNAPESAKMGRLIDDWGDIVDNWKDQVIDTASRDEKNNSVFLYGFLIPFTKENIPDYIDDFDGTGYIVCRYKAD